MASPLSNSGPIKVMIVDDSAVIRGFIGKILGSTPEIEITSVAANGQVAISNLLKRPHDIVLLDVDMPVMDGLTCIPKLLDAQPDIRIIMCSTLTTENAETSLRALSLGAVECIAKPTSTQDIYSKDAFRDTLVHAILEIGRSHNPAASQPRKDGTTTDKKPLSGTTIRPTGATPPVRTGPVPAVSAAQEKTIRLRGTQEGYLGKPDVLAIGSSTGGPNALFKLLGGLRGIDIPIIITQHMPPTFTRILAEHIQQQTGIKACEGEDGMPLVAGRVHIAPGGFHMLIDRRGPTAVLKIDDGPMENFCRPAVDPMLRSAVKVFGNRLMTVILTGMGSDGMLGAREVVAAGGRVVAQDAASSVVWGMPGAVALDGTCSAVLPLDEIGPWLRKSSLRMP